MKRFIILTFALFTINTARSQSYTDPYECYRAIVDSMGVTHYILLSDLERWKNLKEGEKIITYNEALEFIGYYRRNKNDVYKIEFLE